MADTTSYSIDSGNLDMAAITYIFFDADVSATVLQTTTTVGNAVGEGRILVCVVKNNADTTAKCIFQVYGGFGGGTFITGDEVAVNTLTANHISANSITTNELNFTPVQDTDVIARINASAEGIFITADRVAISGSTTFTANYDPSDKRQVYTSEPTTPYYIGDIWTDGTDIYYCSNARASGAFTAGDWTLAADWTNDDTADQAITDAATSQAAADGKIVTFIQAGVPTAEGAGDLWIDSGNENRIYRATAEGDDEIGGGEWVIARDTDIAQAITDAAGAQATADGKIVTFYQDGIPTSEGIGDLWVDTNDSNKLYRAASAGANQITAGEWVLATSTVYDQNYIIRSATQTGTRPDGSALKEGDIWIKTNAGNAEYTYDGASFIRNQTQIDGGYITTGTIDANIARFSTTGASSQRVEINADGNNRMIYYDSGNNELLRVGENMIGSTDGIRLLGDSMIFWYTTSTTAVSQIHCVKYNQSSVGGVQGLQTLFLAHNATNPTANPINAWIVSKVEGIRNSVTPLYGTHTRITQLAAGITYGHRLIVSGGVNSTVYGTAATVTGTGVTNYGIYGFASGATTNWAGYFSGNMKATGGNIDLTGIPTSDPSVAGRIFRTGNDLRISTG